MNLHKYLNTNVLENFTDRPLEKARKFLSTKLLRKDVYVCSWSPRMIMDGRVCHTIEVFSPKTKRVALLFFDLNASQPHTIGFGKNFKSTHRAIYRLGQDIKWDVTLSSERTNLNRLAKLIGSVVSGEIKVDVGEIRMFMKDENTLNESKDPVLDELKKSRKSAYDRLYRARKVGADRVGELEDTFDGTRQELNRARQELRESGKAQVLFDNQIITTANKFALNDGTCTINDLSRWCLQNVPVQDKDDTIKYIEKKGELRNFYKYLSVMSIFASNCPDNWKSRVCDEII